MVDWDGGWPLHVNSRPGDRVNQVFEQGIDRIVFTFY